MKPIFILSFACASAPVADRARTVAPATAPKSFPENMLVPSSLDFHHSVAGLKASGKNSSACALIRLTSLCSPVRHEWNAQRSGRTDGPAMAQREEKKGEDGRQIRHRGQELRRHAELGRLGVKL